MTAKLFLISIFTFKEFNMESQETEQVQTKFNSALPLILKVRDLIFGRKRPNLYTRITAYINLLIWCVFFCWHLISYFAISLRETIYVEKKINVEELIFRRGTELGFEPYHFLNHLLKYHFISIICWGVVFLGIVLIWRRMKIFSFFLFGALAVYFLVLFFYMGKNYFIQDTTLFDKILLALIVVNSLLYVFLIPEKQIEFVPEEDHIQP